MRYPAPMKIDLLSPASFAHGHPHDQYDWLREHAPVYWHEEVDGPGFWALTGYEEVAGIGRIPEVYSSEPTIMIADPEAGSMIGPQDDHKMMLMMDPPRHTRFRRLISREFTRGPAAALRPRVLQLAATILDKVTSGNPDGYSECDFVSQVAGELPSYVIADLMGIPLEDGRTLYGLTEILHSAPETLEEGAQSRAGMEMFGYAAKVYEEKLNNPADDLASQIVSAEVDGQKLDLIDFQLFFMLLIDAGGDTTRNLVAGGLHELLQHPEDFARLRTDAALIPAARDEMLRVVSPVIYMRRTARADTQLGDVQIRAGDKVVRYFGAANHDPAKFTDPHRFDINRTPNPQIAFGTGAHVCLGQHIARVEIDCMFESIFARLHHIEQIGEPQWLASNFISGIRSMPIRFKTSA